MLFHIDEKIRYQKMSRGCSLCCSLPQCSSLHFDHGTYIERDDYGIYIEWESYMASLTVISGISSIDTTTKEHRYKIEPAMCLWIYSSNYLNTMARERK